MLGTEWKRVEMKQFDSSKFDLPKKSRSNGNMMTIGNSWCPSWWPLKFMMSIICDARSKFDLPRMSRSNGNIMTIGNMWWPVQNINVLWSARGIVLWWTTRFSVPRTSKLQRIHKWIADLKPKYSFFLILTGLTRVCDCDTVASNFKFPPSRPFGD